MRTPQARFKTTLCTAQLSIAKFRLKTPRMKGIQDEKSS